MSVKPTTLQQGEGTVDISLLDVPESSNPLQCRYCGKVFTRPFYRKEHERIHTGEKPFACGFCGKMFNSHGSCRKHERIHMKNNKNMECEHCGKKFQDIRNLRIHVRTHTGDKPFSCHICGRSFGFETVLKKHLLFHNGQKQYECLVCSKSYFTSYDLRVHVRSHTGEKPYKCRYCNMSFATGRRRNVHEKRHEKSNVHECRNCGSLFRSASSLLTHEAQSVLVGGCELIQPEKDGARLEEPLTPNSHDAPDSFMNSVNEDSGNEHGLTEVDIEFLGQTLQQNASAIEANANVSDLPYERTVTETDVYPMSLLRTTKIGIKEEPLESLSGKSFQGSEPMSNGPVSSEQTIVSTLPSRSRVTYNPSETIRAENMQNANERNHNLRTGNNIHNSNNQVSVIVSDTKYVQTEPYDSLDLLYSELAAARKVHECKSCGILFRNFSMFLVHKALHVNPHRPFLCHICGEESKDNVDFNSHLIWHMK